MAKFKFPQSTKKLIKIIIILLALVIAAVAAVNAWQKHKVIQLARASQIYQEMLFADYSQNRVDVVAKGEHLLATYSKTPYAQLGALLLAKNAVAENNLDLAAEKLRWAIAHKNSKSLVVPLAKVHLAAVLQQQGKLDEALALVNVEPDKSYISLYAQARGDIYVAKGDYKQAKVAYIQAMENLAPGVQAPLLQLKLMDLGSDDNAQ